MTSSHVRRLQSRVARTAARFVDHAARNGLSAADLPSAKLPWYEVRAADAAAAESPDTTTILLFDEIGGSFGVDASTFVEALEGITSPVIKLRINSPGGSVFDAIAIYNALLHHDSRVVVYVDSLAASAASVIAMAGDEVVMMPGSQMMIHDASAVEDGNAADMAKMSTFLDRQSSNIADIYRRRAGGEAARWRDLMRAETWAFADEAVALGLADRVEEAPRRIADRDERMARSFDLTQFRYAGRRHSPAPGYQVAAYVARSHLDATAEVRSTATAARAVQQSGRRVGALSGVEVRTADDGKIHVKGHAAVFDTPTWIGPPGVGFEEVIAPGAFRKTLADGADVRFLFNHNPDLILARTKSGTLTLAEDQIGLAVTADLAQTSVGRDLAVLLDRGDVDQMSFGFRVVKDRWDTTQRDGAAVERRTVLEAQLLDVSGVTYPAYDETDLALREAVLARELRGRPVQPVEPVPATPPDIDGPGESGVKSSVEPVPATPNTDDAQVEERDLPLHDLLMRHATGDHSGAPRALCPACTRSQPAPATA